MKRRIISGICVILFLTSIVFAYVNIPDTYILYKDRVWDRGNISKITICDNSVETGNNLIVPRKTGDYQASLSFLGIPYKSVTVKVIEEEEVILGGENIGIRLYADSLVVVAVGRVNENKKSPAELAGIKEGDVILKINGESVGTPENFTNIIENCENDISLLVKTGENEREVTVTPEKSSSDGIKRIGLWVRDSAAGVGTLTYMTEDSLCYGALGHAVSDSDTGVKFGVLHGTIEECAIGEIIKGEKGAPGELRGVFYSGAKILGDITKNEEEGIFGNLIEAPRGKKVSLGHKSEIKKGKAYIRTSLDGKDVKEYEIEIVKVSKNSKTPTKGMVIKVTDPELIEKTGGIVQGMSGSPILQNGKIVGAVTHVLVNDPTRGYGIFIENMIAEAEKIK